MQQHQDVLERPATSYIQRHFIALEENASVASAIEQMQSQKMESVIVTRNGLAVGMVTSGDVVEKVVLKDEDSSRISLKSVMSFPLVTISSTGTVKQALQLMRLNRIKRVPVTDSRTGVIGVVTQRSLADAVSKSVLERTLERAKSTFRMRYKPVLGNLGVLLQFSAVLLVVPALVGTALGEAGSITGVYLEVVGLSFTGFFLMAYGEKGQMNLKQASIFIVASFVVMSLFGSLPYVYLNPFFPGIDDNSLFVNSLFESASGFTTTGLSMITQPESLPQSFNFYRSYTQWVGGLSFVYLVMMIFFPEEKLSAWKSVLGGGLLRLRVPSDSGGHILCLYYCACAPVAARRPDRRHLRSLCGACHNNGRGLFAHLGLYFAWQHRVPRSHWRWHDTLRAPVCFPLLHL
jgi:trk system potassium uptake protein TrkH